MHLFLESFSCRHVQTVLNMLFVALRLFSCLAAWLRCITQAIPQSKPHPESCDDFGSSVNCDAWHRTLEHAIKPFSTTAASL
jgi:hypothetical protein